MKKLNDMQMTCWGLFIRREGYLSKWVTLALKYFLLFSSSCLQGS